MKFYGAEWKHFDRNSSNYICDYYQLIEEANGSEACSPENDRDLLTGAREVLQKASTCGMANSRCFEEYATQLHFLKSKYGTDPQLKSFKLAFPKDNAFERTQPLSANKQYSQINNATNFHKRTTQASVFGIANALN